MKLRDWVHPVLYCFEISITRLVQITFFCVCLSLSHDKYHKKESSIFKSLLYTTTMRLQDTRAKKST